MVPARLQWHREGTRFVAYPSSRRHPERCAAIELRKHLPTDKQWFWVIAWPKWFQQSGQATNPFGKLVLPNANIKTVAVPAFVTDIILLLSSTPCRSTLSSMPHCTVLRNRWSQQPTYIDARWG
jgi:hypothetical protein